MISYNHSKRILKKAIIKIKDEKIKSINSLNRTVSKDIYSTINYPSGDNAAFDGYAINSNDTKNIKKNSPQKFKIIGLIAAGNRPLKKKIKKFDAAEIMTGGIVPKGFNTIIPIEQIVFFTNKNNKKYILINKKIKRHNHVRFAGSDYKKKELVIKKKKQSYNPTTF
jgi:molybdopterin molybdotransferase